MCERDHDSTEKWTGHIQYFKWPCLRLFVISLQYAVEITSESSDYPFCLSSLIISNFKYKQKVIELCSFEYPPLTIKILKNMIQTILSCASSMSNLCCCGVISKCLLHTFTIFFGNKFTDANRMAEEMDEVSISVFCSLLASKAPHSVPLQMGSNKLY